ncbi:MAG: hypothetical protein KatS3mg057_1619 [Herpetosiphonaceae bacterium]|nr:MAG: hypothetical protein KatS3mg057_1619 [Herpetosiphonaceae bacterium]
MDERQRPLAVLFTQERKGAARYLLARGTIGLPSLPLYLRTVPGAALLCVAPPLLARLLGRLGWRRAMHRVERSWARAVRRYLRLRLDLEGLEHIESGRSYVVVSLHEGFADILALLHLPLDLRFVARDELFGWRFLGPYLRDTGQIEICPERGLWSFRRLLRETSRMLAEDESLVIFPQGSILGIETAFLSGAFVLARALRRPILPVALTGSHRVWEYPYTPLLRYGQRISLRVLPPIPVELVTSCDPQELRDTVQQQLKAEALSGTMAPPRRFVPTRDGYWDGYAYAIDPAFPELAADIERHRRQETTDRQHPS